MLRTAFCAVLTATVAAALFGVPVAATGDARALVVGCARPLLAEAGPAAQVKVDTPRKFAAAADLNGETTRSLAELSHDDGVWLDRCGQMLHIDSSDAMAVRPDAHADEGAATNPAGAPGHDHTDAPAAAGPTTATPAATPVIPPPADVLTLASRPGSSKTIYLDFTGDTLTNTGWNGLVNTDTLPMAPFSLTSPADTNFTADERAVIFNAWLGIAEDFAPFDVNVTTVEPGYAALHRDTVADQVYGARALFTAPETVQASCGCAGIAYVNTIAMTDVDSDAYQPALVFSPGSTTDRGYASTYLNAVASHELGHNFGLMHDGRGASEYYGGDANWGPIMGSSTNMRLTQWSRGEYANATNTEDDLAIISSGAPVRVDDHSDTEAGAALLDPYAIRRGVIETRTDVDAFTFTGSGPTTVAALAGTAFSTNLDIQMTILAADGQQIALVNPPPSERGAPEAGLDATWTGTLPGAPATYTVLIDGVGKGGDPAVDGTYSDYGSLGQYKVMLDTAVADGAPAPLTVAADASMTTELNQPYAHAPVTATGGTGPYTWTAVGLPTGWDIDPATGVVSGTAPYFMDADPSITVTDATGVWRTRTLQLTVTYTPPPNTFDVPNQTVDGFTVGQLGSKPLTYAGVVETPVFYAQSALPPGLFLAGDGVLTGVPTTAGTFEFQVFAAISQYADSGLVTVNVYPATVTPPPTVPPTGEPVTDLRFTRTALGSGKVGRRYSATLAVAGGRGTVAWKQKGALPKGLSARASANGRTLSVVGKPKQTGRFRFRLTAIDKTGHVVTQTFHIRVKSR